MKRRPMKRTMLDIDVMELGWAVIGLSRIVQDMGQKMMDMGGDRKEAIKELKAIPKVREVFKKSDIGSDLEQPDWEFAAQLHHVAYALKILGSDLVEFIDEENDNKAAAATDEEKEKAA